MVKIHTEDGEVQGERCDPLLDITISANVNVGNPETRVDFETKIIEQLGYIERNIYTAILSGPANTRNFAIIVKIPRGEIWSSINRNVIGLKEWFQSEGYVDNIGRDVSITLEAGDAETIADEYREGKVR